MSEPIWSIPLPEGAEGPVDVYVNSVKLDSALYDVDGRWIRVRRRINPKREMGLKRRLMLGMGIGVYGDLKADQVDISYRLNGRTRFENDATVIQPPDPDAAD